MNARAVVANSFHGQGRCILMRIPQRSGTGEACAGTERREASSCITSTPELLGTNFSRTLGFAVSITWRNDSGPPGTLIFLSPYPLALAASVTASAAIVHSLGRDSAPLN